MKLTLQGISERTQWEEKGYQLPQYDINKMKKATKEAPFWIHFGAGNLFRAFHAGVVQNLLNAGVLDRGLVVAEGFDYEIIEKMYTPHDNLGIVATLKSDGTIDKTVVASVAEALQLDSENETAYSRLKEIFTKDSLQMATFTITEKGYVKDVTTKPVFIKLSPNVTDIVSIAKACEDAGADGICLINTMLGMRIDLKRRKSVIANKMGGFSGDAIFPVAVRMVYQVAKACNIPVMGCGGVSSAKNVIEMMMAGATAVQVGAANLVNPYACKDIIEALPTECEKLGINKLSDIIGVID